MDVVVVESPAKAKTINKYLGKDFVVLASYGHVRDLPAKNGSVRPDEDFAMTYVIDPKSAERLKAIAKACEGADHLYLATDPDREGEAISWHVLKALEEQNACTGLKVKRIVFNEVTKRAVQAALANPRDIDMDLVYAQQARRALDYLVGFTLSPVLWRKLPGARSAGRVQSVALRLICERDLEIDAFKPREYWSIEADFLTANGKKLLGRLVALRGEKLDKFSLPGEAEAKAALALIEAAASFSVANVEAKQSNRNPAPPFTTSTLQQEASRKLRFAARRTMQVAQRLYEGVTLGGETVGLITYMRTDGVQMAGEAISACRDVIGSTYGAAYVPEKPRVYKVKAKNAQEAHEAIRPTDLHRSPKEVSAYLDGDQARLYELIWKRAMASQMAGARIEKAAIDIAAADGGSAFRATGSVILFDGFLRLYQEGRDDGAGDENGLALPKVSQNEALTREEARPAQHFTEPPPRFTEATLVKRLEELGIGRPSTYASIISVLQDRDYVKLDKGRFFADDRGQLVTAFLVSFFKQYVEYDFTADLEAKLDEISAGEVEWTQVLREFWDAFEKAVQETEGLRVRDVLDALNDMLEPHVFRSDDPARDGRKCRSCEDGQLSIKIGKFGAFVGCSNYPDCRFTRSLTNGNSEDGDEGDAGPRELGPHPDSDLMVTVRKGPYGHYIQLGEPEGDTKPKRVSIPKDIKAVDLTLQDALSFLQLPREIGKHPETNKKIVAGIGRFGPYIRHDGEYRSLGADEDVRTIGMNRAVALIAEPKQRRGPKVLRTVGEHPDDGRAINILDGRYGPYVSHDKINASLPAGVEPADLTLDAALTLLRERAAKGTKKRPAKKKTAAKKPTAKKKTTKKTAATKAKKPAAAKKSTKTKTPTRAAGKSGSRKKVADSAGAPGD